MTEKGPSRTAIRTAMRRAAHQRGEPIGRAVRAHDEARPHDRGPVPEDLLHLQLARDLERAVGLSGDLVGLREGRGVGGDVLGRSC